MARDTALNRWPRIVQAMVDDVTFAAKSTNEPQRLEAEELTKSLDSIREEIVADAALKRVQSLFARSKGWRGYDIFKRQKDESLIKSRAAVEELATHFEENVMNARLGGRSSQAEEQKLLFLEMTQIALWGNATDLSLLSSIGVDELGSLQGRNAIEKNRRNVVDDASEAVWSYLAKPTRANRRIDIVLDNAGFELLTDLVYGAYLLESGQADYVVFSVKDFPWFVSDATHSDIDSLLEHLDNSVLFPNRKYIEPLVRRLRCLFEAGSMTLRSHPFWTEAASFHDFETSSPGLFKCLRSSALVIFKGDLNYRKLTMDGLWPHETPFRAALGPLGAGSGIRILALRTNKSDVCVGVEDPDRLESLTRESPKGEWLRDGKHAVISFSDGS
ncbi:Hairy/enhancer-of-split with YRPW motif protein 2 [Vermiconidia calcicola]|uniref:Hairy/enhancer-of-split with YRPW motif protein 2 n=1 Tax=Vermiconidia calcicola TaxID=1690605 RepID=A0ACC3MVD4_9PEZI|nr:Hairy/enhancer-of-split with YRPW motif protein 2 [Vermiconidia calcicola]